MGWGAGGACNQPLHLRLCKVKLVATFLDASDCFSRSLQCNIIGKENNLLQEDLLITHQKLCLDKASSVILFLPLFDHLLLCKLCLLNVAKLGSGEVETLWMFGCEVILAATQQVLVQLTQVPGSPQGCPRASDWTASPLTFSSPSHSVYQEVRREP